MTCSKNFGRLLQVGCLGLIGTLAAAGCGGSESPSNKDSGTVDGGGLTGNGAALNVNKPVVDIGSVDFGQTGTATVVVTNIGTAPSGTLSIAAGAGVTTTGCTGTLAAGANCSLIITATPSAIGSFNSSVSISATPGAVTPLQISVTGSAVQGGVFTVSPTTIDLGTLVAGAVAPKQTLTITAGVALTDLAVGFNGADITKDASSTCQATLAAGATCLVVVDFTANSKNVNDSIVISAGGANGVTKTIPIVAVVQNPAKLVITPSTAPAVATSVGVPSSPIPFGLANSGDVATGALTIAITCSNAAVFKYTQSGWTLLAPLGTCSLSVVFTPSVVAAAVETATLTVTDGGSGASTVSVALSGTAYSASALAITPTAASDLGSVLVGATGAVTVFTVTNSGDTASGALTVSLSEAEFIKASDTCTGAVLAKSATCTIGVQLAPTTVGVKSAILSVGAAGGSPAVKTLTGTGISNVNLTALPVSLDFGSVVVNTTGTAQTVTIANGGGVTTGALTIVKTGDFGMFPITGNTYTAPLAPGGKFTFTVNFAPVAPAGSYTATYTITDGTNSVSVPVAGNALAAGSVTLTTTPYTFTDTVVGGSASQTFTVTGGAPAAGSTDSGAITVALIGGNAADFAIAQNQCTTPLVQGATCQITVAFNPTAAKLSQAGISVSTAKGGTATGAIQGTGLPIVGIYVATTVDDVTTLSTAAADLDFAQVSLNSSTPATKTFRVIVRGPTGAATPFPATTVSVALNDAAIPSNFSYPGSLTTNPCNGATLNISGGTTSSTEWVSSSTYHGYYCDFTVQFFPQGAKGADSATLTASGTGGGSDSKTITGTATGPLTITVATNSAFPSSVTVGNSTNNVTSATNVNLTLVVTDTSTTNSAGPLSAVLSGANAGEFQIVSDLISNTTLAPLAHRNIVVAFTPTAVGAATATLTVSGLSNGITETQTFTINANGTTPILPTLTPAGTPAPVDFGSVIEGDTSNPMAFTIKNPAGAPTTSQFTWTVSNSTHFSVTGTLQGSTGGCGVAGAQGLQAGQSCTLWVTYSALVGDELPEDGVTPITAAAATLTVNLGGGSALTSALQGEPASALTISPTTQAFGQVAVGQDSSLFTFTVANVSPNPITVQQPLVGTTAPFSIVTGGTCAPTAAGQFTLTAAGGATPSCTVVVKMTGQSTAGAATSGSTFVFTDSANPDASFALAKLTGTTVSPANLQIVGLPITATPAVAIDLGSIVNPNATAPVVLTYQNTGGVAATGLHFQWVSLAGDIATTAGQDAATSDPFTVQTESGGCLGLASLAPKATCTVTIFAQPAAATTQGLKSLHYTLSASGGITAATVVKVEATVRRNDTPASLVTFQYADPTTSTTTDYGFFSFTRVGTGATAIGGTSAAVVISLQNNTGSPLVLPTSWAGTLGGTNPESFTVAPATGSATPCTAGATLATSSACAIQVTFNPISILANFTDDYKFASVTVAGNTLGLSGRVLKPANLVITPSTTITPNTLTFPDTLINSAATLTATIANNGETDATTVAYSLTALASVFSYSGCGATIAAGTSCTLTVVAQPTAAGQTAVFKATYAGGNLQTGATPPTNSPASLTLFVNGVVGSVLSLSGTGLTAQGGSAYSFDFGAANALVVGASTSLVETVTITNATSQMSGGLVIALTGPDAASFTLDTTGCASALATATSPGIPGGEQCTVTVTFKPLSSTGTTVPGTFSSTLSVSANPGATTAKTVAITGHGKSDLDFFVSAASTTPLTSPVVVSATNPGTQIFVKLNTAIAGPTKLLSTSLTTGSPASFYITQNSCIDNQLASAAAVCSITIQYVGTVATTETTTVLTVTDGTTGATNAITLQNP